MYNTLHNRLLCTTLYIIDYYVQHCTWLLCTTPSINFLSRFLSLLLDGLLCTAPPVPFLFMSRSIYIGLWYRFLFIIIGLFKVFWIQKLLCTAPPVPAAFLFSKNFIKWASKRDMRKRLGKKKEICERDQLKKTQQKKWNST